MFAVNCSFSLVRMRITIWSSMNQRHEPSPSIRALRTEPPSLSCRPAGRASCFTMELPCTLPKTFDFHCSKYRYHLVHALAWIQIRSCDRCKVILKRDTIDGEVRRNNTARLLCPWLIHDGELYSGLCVGLVQDLGLWFAREVERYANFYFHVLKRWKNKRLNNSVTTIKN